MAFELKLVFAIFYLSRTREAVFHMYICSFSAKFYMLFPYSIEFADCV